MDKIDWSEAPEWADRVVRSPGSGRLYWANYTSRQMVFDDHTVTGNLHIIDNWEVVHRRPGAEPITIEQRIASLRALEKRVEETRAELTRDLEVLGLTRMVRDDPEQPTITDWRDLRVGDVVEITSVHKRTLSDGYGEFIGTDAIVASVGAPEFQDLVVVALNSTLHIDGFRFIRRP